MGPRSDARPTILPRQLTIGECAAIARYGPHLVGEQRDRVAVHTILRFIDQLRVCTTCGWTEDVHHADRETRDRLTCCAQWTRQL